MPHKVLLCFARFVPSFLETLLAVASRKVKREIPNGNLHGVQLHERSREGQGAKIRGCKLLNRGPRYYLDILAIDIFGKSVPIRNFKKWY